METFVASSDLPTSLFEHKFVGVNSAGNLITPTDKGADSIGILEMGGVAGRACNITIFGITKVRGGVALAGGVRITTAASGWIVPCTSGETAKGLTVGNCASGFLASALIFPAAGDTVS
jgi:hypothetical protein